MCVCTKRGERGERAVGLFFLTVGLGWTFRIRNPTDDEKQCESTEGRAGSCSLGGSDLRGMTSRLDRAVCHRVHAIVAFKVVSQRSAGMTPPVSGIGHDVARGSLLEFTARAAWRAHVGCST